MVLRKSDEMPVRRYFFCGSSKKDARWGVITRFGRAGNRDGGEILPMSQLFSPAANTIARVVLAGGVVTILGLIGSGYALYFSPLNTGVGVTVEQPVPFSHQHHVAGLGIDCRYCHTGVEKGR